MWFKKKEDEKTPNEIYMRLIDLVTTMKIDIAELKKRIQDAEIKLIVLSRKKAGIQEEEKPASKTYQDPFDTVRNLKFI